MGGQRRPPHFLNFICGAGLRARHNILYCHFAEIPTRSQWSFRRTSADKARALVLKDSSFLPRDSTPS